MAINKIEIDGLNFAYRETGNPDNPTVLLLHGYPASSHMFRDLIPILASDYHVIAPDHPGFGASDMTDAANYDDSLANAANIVTQPIDAKEADEYAVYLMDYGAPVGHRMFAEHPEPVTGFVLQNGNAYEEGLREFWNPIKAYRATPSQEKGNAPRGFWTMEAIVWQFSHGVRDVSKISPGNYWHVQYLLDHTGSQAVQLVMFLNDGANVDDYAKWQAMCREHQPPALTVRGKNDYIFPTKGAHPYLNDLDSVEFHLLDTGHFTLEDYGEVISAEIRDFCPLHNRNRGFARFSPVRDLSHTEHHTSVWSVLTGVKMPPDQSIR